MTPVHSTSPASLLTVMRSGHVYLFGLMTVIDESKPASPNHLHLDPVSIAIIAEGGTVMEDLQNLPQALFASSLDFYMLYTWNTLKP
ncbi:unnamed protein product [Staurois parvus]|uniref:Uncharacterized protein n=1 Tax=Staurois parvus TaxID=386267 RepID=A0ABN9GNI7_9NEOB|nr:unnamed protein product [Staurois parvus]